MTELVFVHNHFAHGGKHHSLIGDRLFAGRSTVKGVLYQLDGEDVALAVRKGGDAHVPGELYYGDEELFAALDNAHGGDFERRRTRVRAGSGGPMVDAWLWTWAGDWTGAWKGRNALPGGVIPGATGADGHSAWYFGYASNMYHFGERRELTVHDMKLGHIDGWQVAFAKDSQDRNFTYVTVMPRRDGIVRGALYQMPNSEMEASLDPQEKEGRHLERKTYAVTVDDSGRTVWADIYRTLPRWWIWGNVSHPTNTEKIIGGARAIGIDSDYVDWLEHYVTVPCDPDAYDLDLHDLNP
jgi:gamma-glutamylcyclotransferase (GGCT)/AIG2-like uncharacterized protein YtfP